MNRLTSSTAMLLAVMAALSLIACSSSPPARFYTLSPLAAEHTALPGTVPVLQKKLIGVGPITLPAYLNNQAIAIRTGSSTLARSELHRWAGPLEDEVNRVLVENLRHFLRREPFVILQWLEASANHYQIQLNITRFEGTSSGTVELVADWLLLAGSDRTVVLTNQLFLTESSRPNDYSALADAMSRTMAELARRIAGDIQQAAMH